MGMNEIENVVIKSAKWFHPGHDSYFLFIEKECQDGTNEWRQCAAIFLRDGKYHVYVEGNDNGDSVQYQSFDCETLEKAKHRAFVEGLENLVDEWKNEEDIDEEE
jgi:hypothetical protein